MSETENFITLELRAIEDSVKIAALVYPHQLYENHSAVRDADCVYLVEDPLFFSQYNFHKQKLILHRASMKAYAEKLLSDGRRVAYVESKELRYSGDIGSLLKRDQVERALFLDPSDDWLLTRLIQGLTLNGIAFRQLPDDGFLTSPKLIQEFALGSERFFFANFYSKQRKEQGVLLDEKGRPVGGKWSFDSDNRKRLPKEISPPDPLSFAESSFVKEAKEYVAKCFPNALGDAGKFQLPVTSDDARVFLRDFIQHRLCLFGDYEDALTNRSDVVFHSLLSPCLNIGILTAREVLDEVLATPGIPLNSLEGFIRQLIGWREYVRLIYLRIGRKQRTSNFFRHERKLSAAFYEGTLGIPPVDDAIRKTLRTGWCHHIERLMVLGNFMFLCRLDPDEVYRWFMELFIDAYDWVMVPNIYGMSQHADGGVMMTKPYISGSSYIRKMSEYKQGPWCEIWDGLFWTFVEDNKEYLSDNQRMSMMTSMLKKLGPKLREHRRVSDEFLARI